MLLFFLLLLSGTSSPAGDKSTCTPKELARFDCHVRAGALDVRLLPKTIAWNNRTWHTVDEMPFKGEAVAWEKVRFDLINGWAVLQLWLWDKGGSETEVQSLHWYTGNLVPKRAFNIVAEGVVRKRRLKPAVVEPEAAPVTNAAKPAAGVGGKGVVAAPKNPVKVNKPKFLYDEMEKHALVAGPARGLAWSLGHEKRVIPKSRLENAPPVPETAISTPSAQEKKP